MSSLAELLSADWASDESDILLDRADDLPGVAVLVLNRPATHNSISFAMWQQLPELVAGLEEPVTALVLRGAGAAALSVGADITEFPGTRLEPHGALVYSSAIGAAIDTLRSRPYPTIALVRGLAVGGGCELASACDLRIAGSSARLGLPIGRLGVTLGPSEASALADLIGAAQTMRLVLGGELLGADESLRVGLVDEVVEDGALEARLDSMLRGIAAASQPTVRSLKRTLAAVAHGARREDAEAYAAELFDIYAGGDLAEGVAAFRDKRPPKFGAAGREH